MKNVLSKVPVYIVVVIFSLFALIPFYIMIIMGTYFSEDLYTGLKLLPGNYFMQNLHTVLAQHFYIYYANSLIVSCSNTVLALFISALTGFTFAKYNFKGKNVLFLCIICTLMIPDQLGLIGYVVEMRYLHMINTLFPLIFWGMANAFGVFWMRQYISSAIPNELLESAKLDGCNDFRVFAQIVFPIIKPASITLFLLFFLWSWNNYLLPLVTINSQNNYTIPLSISLISSEYRTDYAARVLALTISTIPILLIFAFGSKYLIKGLVGGSVKG